MTDFFFLLSKRYHDSSTYFFQVIILTNYLLSYIGKYKKILEVQFLKMKLIQKIFHSNVEYVCLEYVTGSILH